MFSMKYGLGSVDKRGFQILPDIPTNMSKSPSRSASKTPTVSGDHHQTSDEFRVCGNEATVMRL